MIPVIRWMSVSSANNSGIDMAASAEVLEDRLLHQGRFRLTRTRVAVVETDGMRREIDHEVYRYGPAAAILLYDPQRRTVLLVKQFRLGAFLADGDSALLEVCAGMLDGDTPPVCAVREAMEETGLRVREARHVFDVFASPGGTTEKIACFVAAYGPGDRLGFGGGVDADEHIEIMEMPLAEALRMIDSGEIRDAKTLALLLYAEAKGLIA